MIAMIVSFTIDQDNDLETLTVNGNTYDIYTVYDSKYGKMFDDLNMLIDEHL